MPSEERNVTRKPTVYHDGWPELDRVVRHRTELEVLSYEPVCPRKRDWWRVLAGRYQPKVVTVRRLTDEGRDREERLAWANQAMKGALDGPVEITPTKALRVTDL